MKQSNESKFNYKIKQSRRKNLEALLGLLKLKRGDSLYSNKKLRTHKNEFQRAILTDVFACTKFPTSETREDLALILNHTTRGIQIWFQNNRHNYADSLGKKNQIEIINENEEHFKTKKRSIDRVILCEILEKHLDRDSANLWLEFISYMHSHFD